MLPQAGEAVGAILNGQWKLARLIGEGGLAAVYEAHGQQGQGRRAIKMLHPQFVTQRQIVERFYAEAKACFSLRHPHIASVEAYAYAEDGSPYIVMELLEGISLEEYLRRKQPMPPEMASPLLYGMLQALGAAHARGIVHRDLKPANIFLVPNGELFTVKVLDFGIAKVMDVAGGMGSKTRTGAVLGTPGYMSPEQVKNAKAVDARTDLWGAGVVFFEMLTCQHPFGSSDQLARMVAVLRDPPTPISKVAPALASWEPFFESALTRDIERRFQSAEEMGERLRKFAQGTPARIVPDGLQTVALPAMPDLTGRAGHPGPLIAKVDGASSMPPQAMRSPGPVAYQGTAQSPGYAGHPATNRAPQAADQHGGQHHPSAPPPQHASVPPPQHASVPPPQHASVPPPQHPSHPPPAAHPSVHPSGPPAGSTAMSAQYMPQHGGPSTQISVDKPAGTPTFHGGVPHVHVMTARDEEAASLVWWGVVLVALGAFAMGTLVGYLLGYG